MQPIVAHLQPRMGGRNRAATTKIRVSKQGGN